LSVGRCWFRRSHSSDPGHDDCAFPRARCHGGVSALTPLSGRRSGIMAHAMQPAAIDRIKVISWQGTVRGATAFPADPRCTSRDFQHGWPDSRHARSWNPVFTTARVNTAPPARRLPRATIVQARPLSLSCRVPTTSPSLSVCVSCWHAPGRRARATRQGNTPGQHARATRQGNAPGRRARATRQGRCSGDMSSGAAARSLGGGLRIHGLAEIDAGRCRHDAAFGLHAFGGIQSRTCNCTLVRVVYGINMNRTSPCLSPFPLLMRDVR
jgi:hypothetical protein